MWLILVGLINLNNGTTQNSFLFTNPVFQSKEECVQYVESYVLEITQTIGRKAPGYAPEKFLCVNSDVIQQQMQQHQQKSKEFDMENSI